MANRTVAWNEKKTVESEVEENTNEAKFMISCRARWEVKVNFNQLIDANVSECAFCS